MPRPWIYPAQTAALRITAALALVVLTIAASAEDNLSRLHQHKVTAKESPAPEPGAENELIPSLVDGLHSPDDWYNKKRPELMKLWMQILGKVEPDQRDRRWFGDIRKAVIRDRRETDKYSRLEVDLPIEKDFYQHHLLLLPKNQGRGPFPAVVCWTSSSPDYTAPEQWWGAWLAEHGYVVLTSWSFIRHYRDDTNYASGAAEKVYERFGHWLGLGKMVDDARREAEYLRSLKQVDGRRLGFMGFSLGAKAAVYVAAFAPEFKATVALDPHIAVNGSTNWYDRWYLDWLRPFPDIPTPQHTVLSLLNPDTGTPGIRARSSRTDGADGAAGIPAHRRQSIGGSRRRFGRSGKLGLRQPGARSVPAAGSARPHPVRFHQ